MPRRRPSHLRTGRSEIRRPSPAGLPRASHKLTVAVALLEQRRLHPGAIAQALRDWSQVVRRPDEIHVCPVCDPRQGRPILELALHTLPAGPARELRGLVTVLDERYLARTWPDPCADPEAPWWERRCRD